MFEEISSISEATTAVFAEQKGSASIATICYFHLVASREATYHKQRRKDRHHCHLAGLQLQS